MKLTRHVIFFASVTVLAVSAVGIANSDSDWNNPGNLEHVNISKTVSGNIHVEGKIDGGSRVSLNAAKDIRIGVVGGDGDKKIDGNSLVSAISGGTITLGNKIDGGSPLAGGVGTSLTGVFFKAKNGIDIGNKIDGGSQVKLCTSTGKIHIHDKIDNNLTQVWYWPSGSLVVDGGIQRGNVNADSGACNAP